MKLLKLLTCILWYVYDAILDTVTLLWALPMMPITLLDRWISEARGIPSPPPYSDPEDPNE